MAIICSIFEFIRCTYSLTFTTAMISNTREGHKAAFRYPSPASHPLTDMRKKKEITIIIHGCKGSFDVQDGKPFSTHIAP